MGNSSNWYNYWSRGRPWIKSGWEDAQAWYWKTKMKNVLGFITMLARLTCIAISLNSVSAIRTVAILVLKTPPALKKR